MLTEETFHRTVVYLLEHDDAGTVGVVINRPSRTPVGHVLPSWQDVVAEPDVVFSGGPVQPDGALCLGLTIEVTAERAGLGVLSDSGELRPIVGGVCTVDLDGDVELLSAMTTRLRVFAGHSGWAGGQLDAELADGAWWVVEALPLEVFTPQPRELWKSVLQRQPPPLRFMASYPADPSLN